MIDTSNQEIFFCNDCLIDFYKDSNTSEKIDICPYCNGSDTRYKDGVNLIGVDIKAEIIFKSNQDKERILNLLKESISGLDEVMEIRVSTNEKGEVCKVPF